jgi:hypothetical protein
VAVSEDIDTDDDQGNVEDISNDEEDCVKWTLCGIFSVII